jgi:hypothetical protein
MRRHAFGVVGIVGLGFLFGCSASSPPASGSNGATSDSSDSGASSTSDSGGGVPEGGSSNAPDGSTGIGPGAGADSGAGGGDAGAGNPGGESDAGGTAPLTTFLPTVSGTCPSIATGMLTFAGQQVQVWAGTSPLAQPGPLVIFWYGTGGASSNAVTAAGGIVAAISTSNKQGTDTGDAVWYTGDFDTADQVVACAIQQKWTDTRRIYTTGDSAGGLQATWMAYARSGYIAATAPLSGGLIGEDGFYAAPTSSPQDPTNVPSAIVTHGAVGVDFVEVDFAIASAAYEADISAKGGFSVDCNTGGGHVSGPPVICPAIWQFFEDHPFKAKQDYASGLPSSFPSYCKIGPREADGGP